MPDFLIPFWWPWVRDLLSNPDIPFLLAPLAGLALHRWLCYRFDAIDEQRREPIVSNPTGDDAYRAAVEQAKVEHTKAMLRAFESASHGGNVIKARRAAWGRHSIPWIHGPNGSLLIDSETLPNYTQTTDATTPLRRSRQENA
jgi:hypothetical protein